MSRLKTAAATVCVVAVAFGACAGERDPGPPEILYGADICDLCRMVISEERHAAAARWEGGRDGRLQRRELRFDDPGCLHTFLDSERVGSDAVAWIHDEESRWRRVEEAWLVEDPEGRTPMASGLLAFGSREAAIAAGQRYGAEPVRWTEVAVETDKVQEMR